MTSIPDTFEVNCSTSKLSSSSDLSDLVQKIDLNPTLEQVQRFATSTRGFCTQSESGNVFFVFCLEWEEVEKYVNRVFFPGIKPSVSRKARDGKNEIKPTALGRPPLGYFQDYVKTEGNYPPCNFRQPYICKRKFNDRHARATMSEKENHIVECCTFEFMRLDFNSGHVGLLFKDLPKSAVHSCPESDAFAMPCAKQPLHKNAKAVLYHNYNQELVCQTWL